MNQKTWDRWLAPIIVSAIMGTVFVYVSAFATGTSLRAPFTLGWMTSFLASRLPVWEFLAFSPAIAAGTLYLRGSFEKQTASKAPDRPAATPAVVLPESAPASSSIKVGSESLVPVASWREENQTLVFSSPDMFSARLSVYENVSGRGLQLHIENYRLSSIQQIEVAILDIVSFDSRHGAYRESNFRGPVLKRPSGIGPSSCSDNIRLIWKELRWVSLMTGEGNQNIQLGWPKMDDSKIQQWKASLVVRAFGRPASPHGQAIPLAEIPMAIVLFWESAENVFRVCTESTLEQPK